MKYTELLLDSFYSSPHVGTIVGADASFRNINKNTSDAIKIFLVVNDNTITDAKFQACGSVALFAGMNAIIGLILNKTIEEAKEISEKSVIKEIKQINRCDYNQINFCIESLQKTIRVLERKIQKNALKSEKNVKLKELSLIKDLTLISNKEETSEINNAEIQEKKIENDVEVTKETTTTEEVKEENSLKESEIESKQRAKTKKSRKEKGPIVEEKREETEEEIIDSVPTKIEIRVLDDEPSKPTEEEVVETKITRKVIKKVTEVEEESVGASSETETTEDSADDDVIDEIDSITAKLTDAISKLNFKFDVDDDNV